MTIHETADWRKTDAKGQDDPRFDLLEALCAALDKAGADSKRIRGWFARNPQGLNQAGVIEEIVRLARPPEPVEGLVAEAREASRCVDEKTCALFGRCPGCLLTRRLADALANVAPVKGEDAYALDLQRALTGLTRGGSEYFVRCGDGFRADIPRCVSEVRDRFKQLHEAKCRAIRAEHALSASHERIEVLEGAIRQACDLLAERTHGSPARSAGHNARLHLEAALKEKQDV